MDRETRNTISTYLLLRSTSSFGVHLFAGVYVMFLMAKGLNLLEVNLVNFFFFTTLFICEIPTGAFADVFGRKLSFVISCFLMSTGLFVYASATTFWFFVLAEVIAAIGSTFASGAFQAWLIEHLKLQGYEGSMGPIFAREQQLKSAVAIIAAVLGAYLASKNIALPWIVGGCIMFVAGILAVIYIREDEFERKSFSFREGILHMGNTIGKSVHYGVNNNAVRFILVLGVVQFFAVQAPNMQWQPFFGQFLPNKTSFGFIFAGISIALIIGSALAPWFLRKIVDERVALTISQCVIGVGICTTVLFQQFLPAISIFLIHEVARGLFVPLKDVYLNDNIPSHERATLISFEAVSHHIGGMIGLLVSGVVAQHYSIPVAWIMSGAVLVCSTLILFGKTRK
ncbi:MAG: MFS transporter [Parcubacteria group bacterium]|nr:MFS transporter [Parcubacteria group bacterium]